MNRTTKVIAEKDIEDFIARIAQRFRPKKVIIFGSFAYGKPIEGSDVDILVIMDTSLRSVEQALELRKAIKAPFPMDLIVRTPKQIEERLALGDFFVKEVLTKGKLLYETSD